MAERTVANRPAQPFDDRSGLVFATGAFRSQQKIGVPLYDGVSEAGLAGLLDPNFGSLDSRPYVMDPSGG